jgi:hypothetical protein
VRTYTIILVIGTTRVEGREGSPPSEEANTSDEDDVESVPDDSEI